jgi:predicted transcriptional regulator of viral defense system
MRYLDFKKKLEPFIIFSLQDIRSFEPNFNVVQLSQWQNKGYIKKIIKGKYIFTDIDPNEEILFLIANKLLSPSYVSLEMALSWHGIIPEGVYTVTSVSTIRTITHNTSIGIFDYKKIKQKAFFGYQFKTIDGTQRTFCVASPEKALIDYLYYKNEINTTTDIESLRLNMELLRSKINYELLHSYAKLSDNKELNKRVNNFIKYLKNGSTV